MRVIAGSARRLLLKTVEGLDTRPTTDRIKETLFNMLQNGLYGSVFLDLFSGSGAIGIEALSRGAEKAVFVENGSRQISCIRENLKITGLEDKAKVLACDVFTAIGDLEKSGLRFDFVFMDPPYDRGLEKEVLDTLKNSPLIDRDTLIMTESSKETDFSWLSAMGYRLVRSKEYKTNKHVFLMKEI